MTIKYFERYYFLIRKNNMRFALNIHILEQTQIVGDRKTLSLFMEIRKIVFFPFVFNDLCPLQQQSRSTLPTPFLAVGKG